MNRIAIFPAARQDILDAIEHYDAVHRQLGDRFEGAVDDCLTILTDNPQIARLVEGREPVRRIPVRKFPYGVFYEHRGDLKRIDVLRALHEARSPQQWPGEEPP